MDLLPKSSTEFSQHNYWEKFFKARGKRAFEWYGSYSQLCVLLHKYINPKDNVLIGGCGNSTLGADLYNAGFKSITNVDISETVIKQMIQQYTLSHPDMKFIAMDLLQMNFPQESFTCFLDKGTVDALMSDKDAASQQRAEKMFQEIDRVLKIGGRYICVTLLQEHIFDCLSSFFQNLGWMIRVCRCEEAEWGEENVSINKKNMASAQRFPFPVFVVVCTKFKKMSGISSLLEYSPNEKSVERLKDVESLRSRVQSVQQFASLCHQINNVGAVGDGGHISDDIFIELMDPKSNRITPRYTLFIVDRLSKSNNKFAAFIVPQGREIDWIFNTNEGRRQLTLNAKVQRLIVVHLGREHQFESLGCIQTELSGVVSSLKPPGLPPNTQIPFLSLGNEVNQRREVFRGVTNSTGEYVIEEVEEEQNDKMVTLRRLVFLSNPNVIQSEARLVQGKVDLTHLSCKHHIVMVEELRRHFQTYPEIKNVLVLGLGGGALPSYLHHEFPSLKVDGVDIDSEMVELAKRYFGFYPGAKLKAHVADGILFVQDLVAAGQRYDCVMLDVDCKDRSLGISCPPPSFVEPSFVSTIKACLNMKGLFLLNLVCRDSTMRDDIIGLIEESFSQVMVRKIQGEVNNVIACSNSKASSDLSKK